ncbi:MAG: glycosyltransferase family 2 protein [Thermodesulfovibrionales bacterium]
MSYLIVIPAYNEEAVIGEVINGIKEKEPGMDILVVNDGSSDMTSEIARSSGVKVVDIPYNIGYGGAIQTGFRFAVEYDYDYVITMDGDGQHDPESIRSLIEAMEKEKADVVVGSRFLEGNYRMGLARRLGSWIFSRIANLYTGVRITDPTSGFQIYNKKAFTYLSKGDNYPLDYPDVNVIMALHKINFKLTEAPVRMIEKQDSKSMHSGLRPLFYVLRMIIAIMMVPLYREEE